jgi:uncharacterized phage protein gp47/JayE
MPLETPTLQEIRDRTIVRMLAADVPLSDFTVISALRILLEEGLFPEFLTLYAGLVRDQRDWFIQTATGAALDRRLADYGLARPAAAAANGVLTVNVDADVEIPAGTIVRTVPPTGTESKRYRVDANPATLSGAWPITGAAGSGQVRIVAILAGLAGNTSANTITQLENPVAGVTAVTNAQPLVNGRAAASDEEFREFFRSYLASLTRGTRGSIGHQLLEYVDPASGVKPIHSLALVEWGGSTLLSSGGQPVALQIYIEDGTGTAPAPLVDQIQALVDGDDSEDSGLRSAGVPTEVLSAQVLPVNVELACDIAAPASPTSVQAEIANVIREFVGRLPVGGQLITGELQGQLVFAQLFRRVMDVPSVLRADFVSPTADVNVPIGYKAMPFTVTVSVRTVQ